MSKAKKSGATDHDEIQDDDIAPEYDFTEGERGRHAAAMRSGYQMIVHRTDGTAEVREVVPIPGTVVLDPDLRKHFPDSEAVNRALRELIEIANRHSQEHPITSDKSQS